MSKPQQEERNLRLKISHPRENVPFATPPPAANTRSSPSRLPEGPRTELTQRPNLTAPAPGGHRRPPVSPQTGSPSPPQAPTIAAFRLVAMDLPSWLVTPKLTLRLSSEVFLSRGKLSCTRWNLRSGKQQQRRGVIVSFLAPSGAKPVWRRGSGVTRVSPVRGEKEGL